MENLSCVCVNIFQQLQSLLQSFTAHSTGSGSSTFSHDGGFGSQIPQSNQMNGQPSRFSNSENNSMLPVVLVLFLFAIFFLNNNNPAPGRRDQDLKGRE